MRKGHDLMAKRKATSKPDTYRDAAGIERARDGRRVIRFGRKPDAAGKEAPPRRRPSAIDWMESRGSWSSDPDRNRALAECARRIAALWYDAGLAELPKSPNLLSTGAGTGDPRYLIPSTEKAIGARDEVREIRDLVGIRNWPCLVAVVCEDRSLADAGRAHCGRTNESGAIAVAMDRVIHGVEVVAVAWRMIRY